jgi:hypothetical protein
MFRMIALAALLASSAPAFAETALPDAIAAPGEAILVTLHAVGAQIYDGEADASGKLGWKFREPVATLIADGKTVGRHYVGPSWALDDGGALVGKVVGAAPGATPADVAWLKLAVVSRIGAGLFGGATTVQRINTKGGVATGVCDAAGSFLAVPYEAIYVFLK